MNNTSNVYNPRRNLEDKLKSSGHCPEIPDPPKDDTEETVNKAFAWVTGNRASAGFELVGKRGQKVGLQYSNLITVVMEEASKITLYSSMLPLKIEIEGRGLSMLAELLTSCQVYRIRAQDETKDDEEPRGFVTGIRIEKMQDGDDLKAICKSLGSAAE